MQLALAEEKGWFASCVGYIRSCMLRTIIWDMLLVFLCLRSKDALCHCSKASDSLWYQVSSGITGLTCVQGLFSQTDSKGTFLHS